MKIFSAQTRPFFQKTDPEPLNTILLVLTGVLLACCGIHIAPLFIALILLVLAFSKTRSSPISSDGLTAVLITNYLYWLILILWKTPLNKILTYDYLRWQLRGAFGYLPLLAFSLGQIKIRAAKSFARLISALVIPASIIAFSGIVIFLLLSISFFPRVQLPLISPFKYELNTFWFFGFLRSHEVAGAYYSMISFILLSLFLFGKSHLRTRLLTLLAFILCFWGLIGSKARIYLGAFGVSLVVYALILLYMEIRTKFTWKFLHLSPARIAILSVVSIFIFLDFPGASERFYITFDYLQNKLHHQTVASSEIAENRVEIITIVERALSYKVAIDLFKRHPWTGAGIGSFPAEFIKHKREARIYSEEAINQAHAHNSYLHVAGEMGVVGFILFYGFWLVLIYRLWQQLGSLSKTAATYQTNFCAAVLSLVAGLLAAALFDHTLWSPQIMLPMTVLVGMAVYSMNHSNAGSEFNHGGEGKGL